MTNEAQIDLMKGTDDQAHLFVVHKTIDQVIQEHTIMVLEACHGNKRRASVALNITVRTLYYWLNKWGLFEKYRCGWGKKIERV